MAKHTTKARPATKTTRRPAPAKVKAPTPPAVDVAVLKAEMIGDQLLQLAALRAAITENPAQAVAIILQAEQTLRDALDIQG